MRDPKVIQAEISKLEAELEDVMAHEAMTRSAVHILKNLGWTWTRGRGWKKPDPVHKVFDKDTMTHIKAGDWVKHDSGLTGGYAYVRKAHGPSAQISYVTGVTPMGAMVTERITLVSTKDLKVVSHDEICKARR